MVTFKGPGPDWCGVCGRTLRGKAPCRVCEKELQKDAEYPKRFKLGMGGF